MRAQIFILTAFFVLSSCATSGVRTARRDSRGLFEKWYQTNKTSETHVSSGSLKLKADGLVWPLKEVEVTSSFGRRKGTMHEGVDLRAKVGTPVYAAGAGDVIYAGRRIRGYGQMVVIKHLSGFATVYAHHSKVVVKQGQKVKQGQLIAYSGKSGKARGPHLHFELRAGVNPVNPKSYIASRLTDRVVLASAATQSPPLDSVADRVAEKVKYKLKARNVAALNKIQASH